MRINTDVATTVVGACGSALMAAQPVMAAVDGSFKQGDWIKLGFAIFLAIQGYFTNKKDKVAVID